MSAFLIGRILRNRDSSWVGEYVGKIGPLFEKYGGKVLCRSFAIEKLEGEGEPNVFTVIVEFPSAESARAWYRDDEYRHLVQLRAAHSDGEIELLT
jgi:uncharacterized protein (DUF1330 family)